MRKQTNADLILQHLDKYGIRDKDASMAVTSAKKKTSPIITKRGVARKKIDLHGKTVDMALPLLRNAIDDCVSRGIGELLIIHGYGRHSTPIGVGVLKQMVLDYLEESCYGTIKDYGQAMIRDGGEGATLVRFR